ncbi:MAG: hypothetical protein ABIN67_18105 [Ferruginibacter sp.]
MQNEVLILDPYTRRDAWMESNVSLKLFTDFLRGRIEEGNKIKSHHIQYVLDKILEYPELQGDLPVSEMHKYGEIFELISTILFPVMEDENECLWAIGNALTPEIFCGSNAFYKLLTPTSEVYIGEKFITAEESSSLQKELLYQSILQQLYHYQTEKHKEWIHGFINPGTGLYQYYRINIDKRFAKITSRSPLPNLDKKEIQTCLSCKDGFSQIERKLPIKGFVASGFAILTLTNVTINHAIEQIGKILLNTNEENSPATFQHITLLLKTIIGTTDFEFGIMPILTINNRTALLYENFPFSIIIKICLQQAVSKHDFNNFITSFLKDPKSTTYHPSSKQHELPEAIQSAFEQAGTKFYKFVPVYNKEELVGIFEMSTDVTEDVNENHLRASLVPLLPYVSQLLQHSVDKVNFKIEAIIKDKFTNLQPAVQWKFNEVAWHYFRNNIVENKRIPIEEITFSEVYPLYGAIDIQNSTIERNKALRKDLLVQLSFLREIFKTIEEKFKEASKTFLVTCDYWLYQLSDFITIEQEMLLNDFLQIDVDEYLKGYEESSTAALSSKIAEYRNSIHEEEGIAFLERRKLESSIQVINNAIGQYFDLFKVELQAVYPCYFEKLRTDGVEYDIYLGQSIAPKIPFDITHLQKTRLMQVQSMAALTQLTQMLAPQLQHPLYTTQLLFVHSRPIDISFRNDERRFDVEGAYNIRYHIIKKRIDKVRIHPTNARLTQVGKIALVYYNEKDATEYQIYIKQLQETGVLLDDLEHLELEELQGVSGLKALRVGVNYQ